jgi:beta-galactosidase
MKSLPLQLGSAWYPEQWNLEIVKEDIQLMQQLGFNTVRVGEFAWSTFEPREGEYNTQWLKDALDIAHAGGIRAVVCTPTPTPPLWLLKKYPEIGFMDQDGYQHKHGARQHACYNNLVFRRYSRAITEVMAREFSGHPALLAWQTDNEFRGHQKICVCPACQAGWTVWLEKRYGTVAALNQAWGTAVWSETYPTLADVPPPYRLCYYAHNFSLLVNYRRYMTDSVCEFQREQVEIIRRHSQAPITHNSENSVDEWELNRDLDFASADIYIGYESPWSSQMRFDNLRGLKPQRRFWTMETGSEGNLFGKTFDEGWLNCFAFLSYTSGGEGLSYWPWRQHRAGTEISHSALIYSCSRPTTGWEPARRVAQTRQKLETILGEFQPAPAPVALVRSDLNGFYYYSDGAAGLEPHFSHHAKMSEQYKSLWEAGVWRDVVFDRSPLTGYQVIFSPYLPYLCPEFLAAMQRHLEKGGAWVVGPYSGYCGRDHDVPPNAVLGDLEKMIGFNTQFLAPISKIEVKLSSGLTTMGQMHATTFIPRPQDEVLGTYQDQRFKGAAWGLVCQHGAGRVYVLGSEIADDARPKLFTQILQREGVPLVPLPNRVSLCPQESADGRKAWALCNWDEASHTISLPHPGVNRLTGEKVSGNIILPPYQNAFIEFSA